MMDWKKMKSKKYCNFFSWMSEGAVFYCVFFLRWAHTWSEATPRLYEAASALVAWTIRQPEEIVSWVATSNTFFHKQVATYYNSNSFFNRMIHLRYPHNHRDRLNDIIMLQQICPKCFLVANILYLEPC